MSYDQQLNNITRTKVEIVKLKLGFCQNTYGVSPCTASGGNKCYNTFPTCQDKANYINIGKTYKFISASLPVSIINDYDARPYIKSISDIPTEIKEKDTVVKRLKVVFYDEYDNDSNIDPYYSGRGPQPGLFWKKFIQRNKNFRLGTLEFLQGFEGLPENEFQLKFAGRIDNITDENGLIEIESVDFLKELSKLNYPIKTNLTLTEDVPKIFEALTESEMTSLDAKEGDFCKRKDFTSPAISLTTSLTIGELTDGNYYIYVIAFDSNNRAFKRGFASIDVNEADLGIFVSWSAVSGASFYRIYYKNKTLVGNNDTWQITKNISITSATIETDEGESGSGPLLRYAERYYELTTSDPTVAANWQVYNDSFNILFTGDGGILPASGYVRIDKEIIYYSSKSNETLINVYRGQLGSEIDWHYQGSWISYLYEKSTPANPITALKEMLALAGIPDAALTSKWADYESRFSTGIKVTLKPSTKEFKFSRIYFDLVSLIDCISWVNEEGKIDIRFNSTEEGLQSITDDANIIMDSVSIDYNDTARRTRWVVFWDRFDIEGDIDENDSYRRAEILVDTDSEGPNENNDIAEDIQYCMWLNEDSNDIETTETYLNDLLANRQARTRNAPEIIELSCELKDDDIKTADVVLLTTKYLQDIYGKDYSGVKFRVMKKESSFNRLRLMLMRKYEQVTSGTTGGVTGGGVSGGGASEKA